MKLIIAEKPSLARNIVAGIGTMKKADGYYYNDEYYVSWAFGHLFALYDIEDYPGAAVYSADGKKTIWSMDNLPYFPDPFMFSLKRDKAGKIDAGIKKQYIVLCELMNKKDVDAIINAGDADREGEIIVRLIVSHGLKSKKDILRLWLPDQTPETVKAGLKDLKKDAEYDNLADEGYARTYIDWLYGINLSRFSSLKAGTPLRVGRVVIPVVKAIYDRDMSIKNFVPEIYYALVSNEKTNGEAIELVSKYKFNKDEKEKSEKACKKLNAQVATVTDKKTKKDIIKPGKLYSLSKLQNYLGKKYKMSMDESLKIIQKLYEEGYLTYPRTNSEYLATAEKEKIKHIIDLISKKGYDIKFKDTKTIFDDSKIESHSALTPTSKIPNISALSEAERNVYTSVLNRFVAVFCAEDCVAEKTELVISVGSCENYTLKGTVIEKEGWTKYDDSVKVSDKVLPKLNVGDVVNINFKSVEKQTNPPKHYTIETLNSFLKNPFREDKMTVSEDDEEDYKAIFEGLELGTEATRTGIIENAIKSKYIALKKDVYTILPDGEFLIEFLVKLGIGMDKYKTSELGKALKAVYHSKMSITDAVALAETEIKNIFDNAVEISAADKHKGSFSNAVGCCPLCGKDVVKFKFSYSCVGYKDGCTTKIPLKLCEKNITEKNVQDLLAKKETRELKFKSKKGTDFTAKLKLNDKGTVDFVFSDKK